MKYITKFKKKHIILFKTTKNNIYIYLLTTKGKILFYTSLGSQQVNKSKRKSFYNIQQKFFFFFKFLLKKKKKTILLLKGLNKKNQLIFIKFIKKYKFLKNIQYILNITNIKYS